LGVKLEGKWSAFVADGGFPERLEVAA
jgi:hypothetical protein